MLYKTVSSCSQLPGITMGGREGSDFGHTGYCVTSILGDQTFRLRVCEGSLVVLRF